MNRRRLLQLACTSTLGAALAPPLQLPAHAGRSKRSATPARAPRGETEGTWTELWNGQDLSGWQPRLAPAEPPASPGRGGTEDPQVFSVVEDTPRKGSPRTLLRISGERFGALVSEAVYQNYRLRVEWRWGEAKWAPRIHLRRSSGLVVHSQLDLTPFGPQKPWASGLELDLQEGSCGDLWVGRGLKVDVPSRRERFMGTPLYVYAGGHPPETLPLPESDPRVVKSSDYERTFGDWNVSEALVVGSEVAFLTNGALTLSMARVRRTDVAEEPPVTSGALQLLSEGAELFVRRVALRPLEDMPARFRVRGSAR